MPSLILELEEGALARALYAALRPGRAPSFPRELRADAEAALALLEKYAGRLADQSFTGFLRHAYAGAPPGPPPLMRVVVGEGIVEAGPAETAPAAV
jgi:hypothetical protein